MNAQTNGRGLECVLVDVNTQHDLCDADGTYPVANREQLIPALRRVIAWAKRNHAPVISSIESHREHDLADEGPATNCCIDGSAGQQKVGFTIFCQCARIEVDNTLSIPIDLFQKYQQVIFRKRGLDLLENPKADRFLTQLPVHEFILFGVALERSVKAIALALLARNKRVAVIADACGFWEAGTAELALRQLGAKGVRLTTVDELLARKLDRRHRYPLTMAPTGGSGENGQRVPSNGNGRTVPTNGNGRNGKGTRRIAQAPKGSTGPNCDKRGRRQAT